MWAIVLYAFLAEFLHTFFMCILSSGHLAYWCGSWWQEASLLTLIFHSNRWKTFFTKDSVSRNQSTVQRLCKCSKYYAYVHCRIITQIFSATVVGKIDGRELKEITIFSGLKGVVFYLHLEGHVLLKLCMNLWKVLSYHGIQPAMFRGVTERKDKILKCILPAEDDRLSSLMLVWHGQKAQTKLSMKALLL